MDEKMKKLWQKGQVNEGFWAFTPVSTSKTPVVFLKKPRNFIAYFYEQAATMFIRYNQTADATWSDKGFS